MSVSRQNGAQRHRIAESVRHGKSVTLRSIAGVKGDFKDVPNFQIKIAPWHEVKPFLERYY